MDMTFSPADLAFRDEIRQFLSENLSAHLIESSFKNPAVFDDLEPQLEWQTILNKRGWVGYRWPKEAGGTGWTPVQQYIFDTECARAGAPGLSPLGLKLVGPVIYTYGTQQQKDHYLPKVLSGEHYWCQGFSEPSSGSDLASLKTRALREGDEYVVNGTKIWTSLAHNSNWIFCLVKTNTQVKAQAGISFLLIDMTSPGIEVKPIITIAGDHDVNQVFFDNVRVPVANLVGEEGQGWDIAKFLLANERGGSPAAPAIISDLKKLREQAKRVPDGHGGYMVNDPEFEVKFAKVDVALRALEVAELVVLEQVSKGETLGPKSSISKIVASNLRQKVDELAVGLHAHNAVHLEMARPYYGDDSPEPLSSIGAMLAMPTYLNSRAWTIFGGSNEVQKTILAKTVLGL